MIFRTTNYDEYLEGRHHEAVMARAAQEQCIFVFVEGKSEEIAFESLFIDTLDSKDLGVKIANYNGCDNLPTALRLLSVALNHERPIVLTYDNDPPAIDSLRRCEQQGLLTDLVYTFPIPQEAVVTYPCGHNGGSFEESFPIEIFIESVFGCGVLPAKITSRRTEFEGVFDLSRPWLNQVKDFSSEYGFMDWGMNKPRLAEEMAIACDALPPTYQALVDLVLEVRKKFPVVSPTDVEF